MQNFFFQTNRWISSSGDYLLLSANVSPIYSSGLLQGNVFNHKICSIHITRNNELRNNMSSKKNSIFRRIKDLHGSEVLTCTRKCLNGGECKSNHKCHSNFLHPCQLCVLCLCTLYYSLFLIIGIFYYIANYMTSRVFRGFERLSCSFWWRVMASYSQRWNSPLISFFGSKILTIFWFLSDNFRSRYARNWAKGSKDSFSSQESKTHGTKKISHWPWAQGQANLA